MIGAFVEKKVWAPHNDCILTNLDHFSKNVFALTWTVILGRREYHLLTVLTEHVVCIAGWICMPW